MGRPGPERPALPRGRALKLVRAVAAPGRSAPLPWALCEALPLPHLLTMLMIYAADEGLGFVEGKKVARAPQLMRGVVN